MTGTTRDIGLTGAGKGSRPRSCFSEQFRRNHDLAFYGAVWSTPQRGETITGFKRKGNKLRKTYR